MVYYGYFGVASKHKVAVHGMHSEVCRYRLLGCTQRLRNSSTAKNAPGTWRVPHGTGVGEEIRVDIRQLGQLEDILNVRLVLVHRRWTDEGSHGDGLCRWCEQKGVLVARSQSQKKEEHLFACAMAGQHLDTNSSNRYPRAEA